MIEPMITELQTVDETGTPVERRIPTAEVFRRVYRDLLSDDVEGAKTRAKIRGMRDGNEPYDAQVFRDGGQAYRSNFNDRVMTSILDQRDNATFSLIMDTYDVISVSFTPGLISDPTASARYSSAIASAYTRLFKSEPTIAHGLQKAIRDMDETGLGILVWPDKYDWRFKGIKRARTTFNSSASSDLTDLELLMIMDTMTIDRAFSIIEKKTAEDMGWDVEALKDALCNFFYQGAGKEAYDGNLVLQWDSLQTRKRANDATVVSRQYEIMSIVHGWNKERSGKVTHSIIALNPSAGPDRFLYTNFEEEESLDRVAAILTYSFGEGTLKSVKGLGHEVYTGCLVSCRRLNSIIDTADLAGSLLVQNAGSGDNTAFSVVRAGPLTFIDKGLDIKQQSFNPNIESPLAVRSIMNETMNNNVGIFRPRNENPGQSDSGKTAEQIRYEAGKESSIEADRLFAFYLILDAIHTENMRRILDPKVKRHASSSVKKSIELFWDICLSLGVPEEFLTEYKDHIQVKATRSIGAGSPAIRLNNLRQLKASVIDTLDEAGRRSINRAMVVALAGSDNVDEFHPIVDRNKIPSDAASFQTLENNDIMRGVEVLVGADQIHYLHATTLMALIIEYAQAYAQDPQNVEIEKMANVYQYGIPHLLRHLQYMEQDITRKEKVAEFQAGLQQAMPIYQQAMQEMQQRMQQKAQEQQAILEENARLKQENSAENLLHQREMYKAQLANEVEREKMLNLNKNRDDKTQGQLEMAVEKLGAKLAMDQQSWQSKMAQDIEAHRVKIMTMMEEAQAKMAKMRGAASGE